MFRFANPVCLWLLPLIPLMIVLFPAAAVRRRRRLERFGNPEMLRQLMPDVSPGRVRLMFILLLAAYALIVLAAARP